MAGKPLIRILLASTVIVAGIQTAEPAGFLPFIWQVTNIMAATWHAVHAPPVNKTTAEFTNPCTVCGETKEQVLVNSGLFATMPGSSSSLAFDFIYNSNYVFPPNRPDKASVILANIDALGRQSVLIAILPPGAAGSPANLPVLSVSVTDAAGHDADFRIPNMLSNDGQFHDIQFSLRPNPSTGNWYVQARRDNVYNYDNLVVYYEDGLPIIGPGRAFDIPMKISPWTNQPFTWSFANIVKSAENGFGSLSPDGLPGFYGLNATVARFWFQPNGQIDINSTTLQGVFWNQQTGQATILDLTGALNPGDVPPPIFLSGTASPSGFPFNGGEISHVPTSFIVPLGDFAPPTPNPINPYP